MGPIQTVEDLLGLIRRRFWVIVAVSLFGTLAAVWYAKTRPDVFETAAVLQVELPMVTDGGQAPAMPVNVLQLLTSIEQRLTTRDNLIALIDRHGLFADAPAMSIEDKVTAMRQSVGFQSVTGPSGALSALIISARAGEAENAARIANDLAQSVLDMGAEGKRATADASFGFFKEQENRLWGQITALEAEIAAYRDANRSSLPGVREARQDEIAELETSMRALDQEITGLRSEETQVRALQTQRATDRRRLDEIGQRLLVLVAQRAPLAERKALLEALQPMARFVREQGYPPESIDILTAQGSGPAPSGFSAAVLPFLRAVGDDRALQSQRMRLEARPLRPTAYYEQVLGLFGLGAMEGHYRFTANGQLTLRWKP